MPRSLYERSLVSNQKDPCIRLSLEIAMQLYFVVKYERLAEIYLAAYKSWQISTIIIQMGTERNREIFKDHKKDFIYEDYYIRTLAIKGILHSFVDEIVNNKKIELNRRIDSIIELILLIFNIPEEQIKKCIKKTHKILKKEKVNAYSFEI